MITFRGASCSKMPGATPSCARKYKVGLASYVEILTGPAVFAAVRQRRWNMSKLLIKLRDAPEDEIEEIRTLLREYRIDFYETQGGAWGISAPGIWLNDESQYDRAKALMDDYQENRFHEKRAEYERLRQAGQHRTFLQNLLDNPVQVILYSLIVGLILYLSISPFFPDA